MSTTTYDFGEIVLVEFPFTNFSTSKKRPALVVSGHSYNSARPDIILMAVTSQLRAALSIGDVWLTEWRSAGLLKPSAAKPVLFTFEKALILKRVGRLSAAYRSAVRSALASIFE